MMYVNCKVGPCIVILSFANCHCLEMDLKLSPDSYINLELESQYSFSIIAYCTVSLTILELIKNLEAQCCYNNPV